MTRTLDCPICEQATVHAMLSSGCQRDGAERWAYKRASWMQALSDPEGTIA